MKEGHERALLELEEATCRISLETLESGHGVRYSVLTDVLFFEPIRYPVVYPMHNLLPGTSKNVMNLWIKRKVLITHDLQVI